MKKIITRKITALLVVLAMLFSNNSQVLAQCTNATSYGSAAAPGAGISTQITTCQYGGEYHTITGALATTLYRSTSSVTTDFITVHQGTPAGPVIAASVTPLVWSSTVAGTYYVHINTNAACGTLAACRTTTIDRIAPLGCTYGTLYATVNAPTVSGSVTQITTCQFNGENATINLCGAATTYKSTNTGGFVTIHQGSTGGPIIASGPSPLIWTSTVAGTYYQAASGAACATGASCLTTTIECLSCPGGAYNPCATIAAGPVCGAAAITTVIPTGTGAWALGPYAPPGQEKLYTFTPAATGNYSIRNTARTTTGSYTDVFYKASASGCNNTGWTFLIDVWDGSALPYTTPTMALTGGTQYYFMFDRETTVGGNWTWDMVCPAPPVNDACATPINITPVNATCTNVAGSNVLATAEATPGNTVCNTFAGYNDVWFTFTATSVLTNIEVTGGTLGDGIMGVYTGACGALTEVACNDDNGLGSSPKLSSLTGNALVTTIGTQYRIRIAGWANAVGTFNICVYNAPVPFDPCGANIQTAAACGATTQTTTIAAGGGIWALAPYSPGGQEDIWNFTCPSTGSYSLVATASTAPVGANWVDFFWRPFNATCDNTGWTFVDDIYYLDAFPLTEPGIAMTGGQVYQFLFDPENTAGQNITWRVNCAPVPLVCPTDLGTGVVNIPSLPYLNAALTTAGQVNDITVATISATVCGSTTYNSGEDMVFVFTPTISDNYEVWCNTASNGASIQLYNGCPLTGNTPLCLGAAQPLVGNCQLHAIALTAGVTYYLVVDSWNAFSLNFPFTLDIHATPPPPLNDNCLTPTTLTPAGPTCVTPTSGTTVNATSSGAAYTCGGWTGAADDDVWYTFTATSINHVITMSNVAPAVDGIIVVYTGTCGALTPVACADATVNGQNEVVNLCATVGVTYLVRIYSFGTGTYGTFDICVTSPGTPPLNDECIGAVSLTPSATASNTTGTLQAATNCSQLAACTWYLQNYPNADVWYKFVAGVSNPTITVAPGKALDAVVQLYTGVCGGLGSLLCGNNPGFGVTENLLPTGLTIGATYYVRVYDYYGSIPSTPGFAICVTNPTVAPSVPANDDCAGAVTIIAAPTCTTPTAGTTDGATQTLAANATCSGFTTGTAEDDVWYKFVATATAHTITIVGSDPLDPVVEVYSGVCGGLTSITCEDASVWPYNGGTEAMNVGSLTIGTTYYVRVYGYGAPYLGGNNTSGAFTICVTDPAGTPPVNDACPGTTLAVSAGPTCTTSQAGTVLYAFPSAGVPAPACGGTPDDDVWYQFTATQAKHDVTVTPSASLNAVVQCFSGACGTLTAIGCANSLGNGGVETVNLINLTIGQVYKVRVFDAGGSQPATVTFNICVTSPVIAPAPFNDACTSPVILTMNLTCVTVPGSVESATASGNPVVCGGTADDDVWYSFVANAGDAIIDVIPSASMDAVVQVYSGASCAGLTSIACANSLGIGGAETVNLSCLGNGQTYFIRVYDFFTGEPANPTFNICVYKNTIARPVNDLCSDAISVSCGTVTPGSSVNASGCGSPGACGIGSGGTPGPGVWYKFTSFAGEYVEFSTCTGTSWDTKLHAYSGTCAALTCIASNDDYCGNGLQSQIGFPTVAGTTYYILVNGYANATGAFNLTTNCYTCTISTSGGQTSTNNATPVVNDAVTVSLTGQIGSVVQWEASFDNFATAPIVLGNAGSNNLTIIMNANVPFIYFRALVQNGPACLTAYSSVVQHKMLCAPAIATSCAVFGDYVGNVTFNTINNTSTYSAGGDMYEDWTNISTNVIAGNTYTLSVTPGQPIYAYARMVWIDANGNGNFNDPGENVMLVNAITGTTTTPVTIPCTAIGDIKMRVIIADNGANTQIANADACYNPGFIGFNYGEVEEYTLQVAAGPNLTVSPNASVCAGGTTVVLTASGGNTGTYAWAPTAGIISSTCAGATCAITVQNAGISFYTVTGTVTANGCPGSVIVPVTTVPVAGVVTTVGGTIICPSGLFSTKVLTLTGAAGAPLEWQWSLDNIVWNLAPGITDQTTYTTPTTALNYYYRCVSKSPLCYDISSNTILIEVSAVPTITIGAITSTSIVVSWTPVGSGNYTVSWNGTAGTGVAAGAVSPYTITGLNPLGGLLANITVSQSNPGSNCFPASATVTNVLTLCAPPPAPTFGATTPTTTVVNIPAGSTSYKVYYRFIAIYNNYVASPCIAGGGAYTIVSQWAGQPISVYLQACNCPTTQNGQAGPAVIKYLLPGTSGACTAPTPFALAQVTSDCPNRIQVDLQGSPNNNYRVTFQRLLPVGGSANSYPVLASGIMNYTVSNTPLPQVWQVWAVSACGPNATAPYSTMTDVITVTVKSGCNKIQNLLLSHATCHGFTATWNVGDCGVPSTNLLGYHCFVKAGTGNWNAYGSTTNVKTGSIWGSGLLMQVYVRANSCNGSFGQSSDIQTIMTLSGAGCREEDQQVEESLNHDGVTTEYGTLSVYPNPNQGQFVMDLQMGDVTTQDVRIEVMNMLGQIVMTQITSISDGHLTEGMGLSENIASGNYMVRVMAGEKAVFNTRINISK